MKKTWMAVILLAMVATLSGCSGNGALSEEVNDQVAEYMAGVLLKYDKKYDEALLYELPAPTPEPTPTPVPVSTPKSTQAEDPVGTASGEAGESLKEVEYIELNELIGDKDIGLQYLSYKMVDSYPENPEIAGFSLNADKGYKLLVVEFEISNLSNKKKKIVLKNNEIDYKLDVNASYQYYKPSLTVLENDLSRLEMELGAGKKKQVVLVFKVSLKPAIESLNLFALKGSRTSIIKLK